MSLDPVAFDIETTGFDPDSIITVGGFAHGDECAVFLNTRKKKYDATRLQTQLDTSTESNVDVTVVDTEPELLAHLTGYMNHHFDTDNHYLCAFNGETWKGGFDLPFCRTRYLKNDMDWPFNDIAYVDVMDLMKRFATGDDTDLVGTYDSLIGRETCDPFDDSAKAVEAFENGNWLPLLEHNVADIIRTYELADLAGDYVAKSDFNMKSLSLS